MAALLKKFAKPHLTGLLKQIPFYVLDKQLTDEELRIISKQMTRWEDKAPYLGLSKTEIEDIEKDYKHSNQRQRIEMLIKWKEKKAYEATLGEILRCASRHGWTTFGCRICKELGHLKEGKKSSPPPPPPPHTHTHTCNEYYDCNYYRTSEQLHRGGSRNSGRGVME